MLFWARLFTLLFVTAVPVSAQGLLQLTLTGAVDREGGAYVEIEIAALVEEEARVVEFNVHLGHGTTAAEVVQLVAAQMQRAGMDVTAPIVAGSHGPDAGADSSARLFVHRARFCNLRLGGGLEGELTLCDRQPKALRILPPQRSDEPAMLTIFASTRHPHTKARGEAKIEFELPAKNSPGEAAELLVLRSIESGWVAERPRLDIWRPIRLGNGTYVVGCSIKLGGRNTDWRLEVEIEEESLVPN